MTKLIKQIMLVATQAEPDSVVQGCTNYQVVATHPDGSSTEVDIPQAAGKILEKHPLLLVVRRYATPDKPLNVSFELTPEYSEFLHKDLPKKALDKQTEWAT